MKKDYFREHKVKHIDYKDTELLKKFLNPYGRINSRKKTDLSGKHQRKLSEAVKRARFMALIPFIVK